MPLRFYHAPNGFPQYLQYASNSPRFVNIHPTKGGPQQAPEQHELLSRSLVAPRRRGSFTWTLQQTAAQSLILTAAHMGDPGRRDVPKIGPSLSISAGLPPKCCRSRNEGNLGSPRKSRASPHSQRPAERCGSYHIGPAYAHTEAEETPDLRFFEDKLTTLRSMRCVSCKEQAALTR